MSRPNIILIITDQQRYDTVAALGFPHVDTPHLDALVRDGVSFSQCHVTAPSCGPSRASLFTGYYPHNVGALRNNDPWPRTWVEDLRAAGYYCVNVGKMHAEPYSAMHGFHERFVVGGTIEPRSVFQAKDLRQRRPGALLLRCHFRARALPLSGKSFLSAELLK